MTCSTLRPLNNPRLLAVLLRRFPSWGHCPTSAEMERARVTKCCSTKMERRIIEKNRRNQMKFLCSKLNSLLPIHNCKEAQTVADRIDEAINYIKLLETKLSESTKKKESLLSKKRSHKTTISEVSSTPKYTKINIQEMGSSLDVVLTSGLENQFIFYEVIRIFHDEQVNVVQASCSVVGATVFHTVRGELATSHSGAAKITDKLNRLVNGCSSEGEFQADWWDLDVLPQTWEL